MRNTFLSLCGSMSLICGLICQPGYAVQPYDSIRPTGYEPYFLPNSYLLGQALSTRSGTSFIDVNTSGGAAARYIAQSTDGSIAIYSIGLWDNEGSFRQFLSNIVQENSASKITPIRMTSNEAAEGLNLTADVIYIDTSEATTVGADITRWFPHLNPHGALCGDNWNDNDVALAILEAITPLDLSVSISGSFWSVFRP